MSTLLRSTVALVAALLPLSAAASEGDAAMEAYLAESIRPWSQDPVIIDAIRAQNAVTGAYDDAQIAGLDALWSSEIGQADQPTISAVLNNAASDVLRQRLTESGGVIREIFVMDARGLNVASSDVTSDYWQGDEAKWQETYAAGPDGVNLGEIEFDDSSQRYVGQISFAITDPDTGEAIGAMTVSVDAEHLM